MKIRTGIPFVFALILIAIAGAEDLQERGRLYRKLDAANTGGIRASVERPVLPIEQVLAIADESVEDVYEATISGANRNVFEFRGLPVGTYDLVVVFASDFYEGLQLAAESGSLEVEDRKGIEASIQRSEAFFTRKILHRVDGLTGRGQRARALCTYFRDIPTAPSPGSVDPVTKQPNMRRTFKLVLLKNVGPGWQIERARDLYPVWARANTPLPRHQFSAALNQVRVADRMKDIGALDLQK